MHCAAMQVSLKEGQSRFIAIPVQSQQGATRKKREGNDQEDQTKTRERTFPTFPLQSSLKQEKDRTALTPALRAPRPHHRTVVHVGTAPTLESRLHHMKPEAPTQLFKERELV